MSFLVYYTFRNISKIWCALCTLNMSLTTFRVLYNINWINLYNKQFVNFGLRYNSSSFLGTLVQLSE